MDSHRPHAFLLVTGALALIGSMAGCMTATPYQPFRAEGVGGVHGGYSEERISPTRFRVKFHGNELASRERVEDYLLYRAAELTVTNGYDSFSIADRHIEHDVETYVRQNPWGYWQPYWRYYRSGYGWDVWFPESGTPFWADRVDVTRVESFEVEAEIALAKGIPGDPKPFDARRVMAEIGPAIELPNQR